LDLIRHAVAHPQAPHFLILDEMNLSHVERYFADLLSAIESGEPVPLYSGQVRKDSNGQDVAERLTLPGNLFVIGTVNVDETTYMFSPKVLDRANVIEFRMDTAELASFLAHPQKPDLTNLDGKGVGFGEAFVAAANDATAGVPAAVKSQYEIQMRLFFDLLYGHGAEYGYRVAHETARYMHFYHKLSGHLDDDTGWFDAAMDAVIVQKFLPKLHGSRAKLGPLLKKLWQASIFPPGVRDPQAELKEIDDKAAPNSKDAEPSAVVPQDARYPISAEKIARMWRLLADNGFASFAEA
jgi:5-methylcytosine-specific restriction endonuclease McrBC GTP-binding regulatory subunit McrB